MDFQFVGWVCVCVVCFGFGLVDVSEDLFVVLQIMFVGFGQCDLVCCVVQEMCVQVGFEI